jgi:hypothetical protein
MAAHWVDPTTRWRCHEDRFRVDSSGSIVAPRTAEIGADLPLRGRSTNAEDCLLAVIPALAACTFKTRALTDFALFNHLIRAGAAVAGYAGPEAADFPVKLVLGYIGID